jgi:tetratricopeptide (TPR) repeat protein
MENYYRFLGLSPNASSEEIEKLIHHQIRLWSARTNAPHINRRQEAEQMLSKLETIEATLLDKEQRIRYDELLQNHPVGWPEEKINEALSEGFRLLEEGQPEDSLFIAIKMTEHIQDRAEAWALLGQARFAVGEIQEAIISMSRACELAPSYAKYAFLLGQMYHSCNRLSRAEEAFEHAISLEPSETKYQYQLGALYVQHGNFKHGLQLLEKSVEQDPKNDTYKEELVRAYLDIAFSTWKEIGEGHEKLEPGQYPTSQADVTMAYIYVKRASRLGITNKDWIQKIKQARALIRKREGRQFTGSWLFALVSTAELVLIQQYNPSMINVCLIGLLPLLYIFATFTPRYRVYQWAVMGKSTRTDAGYMLEIIRSKLKFFGTLVVSVFAILPFIYMVNPIYFVSDNEIFRNVNFYFYLVNYVLPVVLIINLYRNYVRKPI